MRMSEMIEEYWLLTVAYQEDSRPIRACWMGNLVDYALKYERNPILFALAYNAAATKYHGEFAKLNEMPLPPEGGK